MRTNVLRRYTTRRLTPSLFVAFPALLLLLTLAFSRHAVLPLHAGGPCLAAPAGLVGWWRAEGTAVDAAGTNNAVLEGAVGFASGEVGQAFQLNGTNADVRVPASPGINVGLADGFTIEAWINPADVGRWGPVAEWNDGSFGVNFSVADPSGAGPGSLWIDVKDTDYNDHFLSTGGGLLVSNKWQHVAVTYTKASGYTVLYVNGVPQALAELGVFTPRTIGDLYFGLRPHDGGAGARFAGLMDEVSLYRRALSGSEIAAIYNAGSAGKCPSGVTPPTNCVPAPTGLVSWWPGEGNANDAAGLNNGTVQPGTTFAPGVVGQAFSFNAATGDTVDVPDSASLRLTNQLTVEAWIKARTEDASTGCAIVSKISYATGNYGYQFILVGNTIQGLLNSPGQVWPSQEISSGPIISTGVWYHVAWTYDQSAMKLYCNGQPVATNVIGAHMVATSSADLRISGADNHGYFDGLIDEPSVYNRALSDGEIAAIYNGGAAGKCPIPVTPTNCVPAPGGLVSWWRAEGAANDSEGTNNGILEGGTTFAPGEVGQAFRFNGTNADVRVAASASLNVSLADGFTIETWINPADTVQWHPMVEWNDGSFGVNFSIADAAGAGPGSLFIDVKDIYYDDHFFSTPGGLLVSNTWQHVAVTYTRTNGYTVLYINGVRQAQATLGVFTPRTIGDLYFGLRPYDGGAGTRFVGLMDEVSLYRRALSASEIAAIYNAGSAGKCVAGVLPSIVSQPQSETALAGSTVAFSVSAVGDAPLGYQWRFQGANLPGQTNSTLTLPNVQLPNAGSYSVLVSNLIGSVLSSNALLTVIPISNNCVPPPPGLVGWWRGAGTAADSAGTNNGVLEGGAAFAPGKVGQAFSFDGSGGYVQVPDSDLWAFGTSNFTIELWANFNAVPDSIYSEPQGGAMVGNDEGPYNVNKWFFALGGGLLTFHVNGPTLGPIFLLNAPFTPETNQWYHLAVVRSGNLFTLYRNGVAVAWDTNSVAVPNANAPLTIGKAEAFYFNGLLDEVSIYRRDLSVSEIAAIYHAGSAGKCPLGVGPAIVTQPTNQTAYVGGTAVFSITAAGGAPLSYQWRFQGINLLGRTNFSLILSNVQLSSAGSYSVVVSNLVGSVISSNALLTVIAAPSNCVPAPVGLVSWWRAEGNANDAADSNNGTLRGNMGFINGKVGWAFSFNGTNADVLVPASPSLDLGAGAGLSIEAWINPASVVQQQPLVEWNSGSFGVNFWISTEPVGGGAGPGCLTVNLKDIYFTDHSFATPGGLIVPNVWQHVAATYNKTTGYAALYVNGALSAQTNIGVFTPMTTGDLYFGVRPFDAGAGTRYMGDMDEVAVFNRSLTADEVQSVYAASSGGICPLPPIILVPPASQTVTQGSAVTFTVAAAGTPQLRYQWYFNGTNIVGATGSSLTLTGVRASDAGSYSVQVTNAFGSVVSPDGVLTINPSPCLRAAFHPDGSAWLQFSGYAGRTYRIEVSADLVNWVTLGACIAGADGNAEFTDLNPAHQSPRFYRAVEQ